MAETKHLSRGQPRLFSSVQALEAAITDYITTVDGRNLPTITGLAYHLGFESRQSIYDYIDEGNDFSYVIKRARLWIESEYEKKLAGTTPTGAIFWLKNAGWKDNQDIKIDANISLLDLSDADLQARLKQQAAALGLTISGQVIDSDN